MCVFFLFRATSLFHCGVSVGLLMLFVCCIFDVLLILFESNKKPEE